MTSAILPEINFLTTNAEVLANEIIATYEQLEGRKLAQADPLRLIFLSFASFITKQNVAINDAAKQNLLYYARNEVLDHKGEEWDTPRLPATPANTILRMHLSTPLMTSKIVPKGTLATSSEGAIFFASTKDVVIQPGDVFVDLEMQCTIVGPEGNNFTIGEINTLVNPLPYVSRVENIKVSSGGAEREGDEQYRERVYLSPEKISSAGPEGAYEYYTKSASSLIGDVLVDSPEPGRVVIRILLQDGQLPTQGIIDDVYKVINARKVRPLTDLVTVTAPDVVFYDLDVTYYLDANILDMSTTQLAVEKEILDYQTWQSSKIGRDINPSKLISNCMKAGAKRVDIKTPIFTVVNKGQVAQLRSKNVKFGGVEDD